MSWIGELLPPPFHLSFDNEGQKVPKLKPTKRIEICGGIASGKTTLAHLLVDGTDYQLALENFRGNPFWARFYQDPQLFAAEKNVCFLSQHTGEIKYCSGRELLVCDYAVFQDLAYAEICSASGHLDTMHRLFDHLYGVLPEPAMVINLQCDPVVQLERIRARAREEEKYITLKYLDSLNKAIPRFLRQTLQARTLVYDIRSDQLDFANDPIIRSTLRDQVYSLIEENTADR